MRNDGPSIGGLNMPEPAQLYAPYVLAGRVTRVIEAIVVFLSSFLFFLMLAIGPFPLEVGGVLLDRLTSAVALILLLFASKHWKDSNRWLLVFLSLGYLLALAPSVIFAQKLDYAIERYLIFAAYGAMFSLVVLNRHKYIVLMRITAVIALLVAAGIVHYVFLFSDYYEGNRFALAASAEDLATLYADDEAKGIVVDPAHTAFGLILTFLMGLPLFDGERNRIWRNLLVVAFLLLLSSQAILISRTAAISILLGVMIGVVWYARHLKWRHPLNYPAMSVIGSIGVAIGIVILWSFYSEHIAVWTGRFVDIVESETHSVGRLTLIAADLECFLTDVSTALLGCGYASSNPHNELVRNLGDSGVIALIAMLLLLIGFYWISRKLAFKNRLHVFVDVAFWPFFFMLQTYGHVKTFWAGLAIVWLASVPNVLPRRLRRH